MMVQPQAWYKQTASMLKPFYNYMGPEFLENLEDELYRLGLDNYAETVELARNHLEANHG